MPPINAAAASTINSTMTTVPIARNPTRVPSQRTRDNVHFFSNTALNFLRRKLGDAALNFLRRRLGDAHYRYLKSSGQRCAEPTFRPSTADLAIGPNPLRPCEGRGARKNEPRSVSRLRLMTLERVKRPERFEIIARVERHTRLGRLPRRHAPMHLHLRVHNHVLAPRQERR